MLDADIERRLNPEWYLRENFKVNLLHSNKTWYKWCFSQIPLIKTNHLRVHSQRILQNFQFREDNDFITQLVNVTNTLLCYWGHFRQKNNRVLLTRCTGGISDRRTGSSWPDAQNNRAPACFKGLTHITVFLLLD